MTSIAPSGGVKIVLSSEGEAVAFNINVSPVIVILICKAGTHSNSPSAVVQPATWMFLLLSRLFTVRLNASVYFSSRAKRLYAFAFDKRIWSQLILVMSFILRIVSTYLSEGFAVRRSGLAVKINLIQSCNHYQLTKTFFRCTRNIPVTTWGPAKPVTVQINHLVGKREVLLLSRCCLLLSNEFARIPKAPIKAVCDAINVFSTPVSIPPDSGLHSSAM